MKWLYKFMEVYVWLLFSILGLLGFAQNIYFGNIASSLGMLGMSIIFMFVYIREKNLG